MKCLIILLFNWKIKILFARPLSLWINSDSVLIGLIYPVYQRSELGESSSLLPFKPSFFFFWSLTYPYEPTLACTNTHTHLLNEKWKMAFPSPQDKTVTFHLDRNPVCFYWRPESTCPLASAQSGVISQNNSCNHLLGLPVWLTFTKWLSFL